MKRFVIVKPGCRDVANELLNHMSIYAAGLEAGARVVNHSPWGYPPPYTWLHALYARMMLRRHGGCALHAWRAPVFLPPSKPLPQMPRCDTLYFFGWVFRNPVGLQKFRPQLLTRFARVLPPLPAKRIYIGVHMRQKPFAGFPDGTFLVPPTRVRAIIDEYLRENGFSPERVTLRIVSDHPIPPGVFDGYSYEVLHGNTEKHLFALSQTKAVIGTNTTFPNLAAWFGDVPHIVTTNEPVDWEYYKGNRAYFENRFATFAF